MQPTERTFTEVQSGYLCRLYRDAVTHQTKLIYELPTGNIPHGTEPKNYYASHFEQQIKLNTGKIVTLSANTFYHCSNNERVTHRKIEGLHKKFVKI
jgi:hypothetical protein